MLARIGTLMEYELEIYSVTVSSLRVQSEWKINVVFARLAVNSTFSKSIILIGM